MMDVGQFQELLANASADRDRFELRLLAEAVVRYPELLAQVRAADNAILLSAQPCEMRVEAQPLASTHVVHSELPVRVAQIAVWTSAALRALATPKWRQR